MKSDVLALVDDLLLKPDTTGDAEDFYAEVIRELGFREFLTGTRTQQVMDGVPQYTVATDTIRVLESHLGHIGRLDPVSGQTLRAAFGSNWRDRTGSPYHITRTDQSSNVVRLFPTPDCDSELTFIRTETRDDLPYWLELPVALEVTSRLLIRESPNQDPEFANQAKRLSTLFFSLLGLRIRPIARGARRSESEEL